MLFQTLLLLLLTSVVFAQADNKAGDIPPMITLQDAEGKSKRPSITLSSHWDVLGPFQIGTRGRFCSACTC